MINEKSTAYTIGNQEISEISAISALFGTISTPDCAFKQYTKFLEYRGYHLLLVSSCNTNQHSKPKVLYTHISASLEAMCSQEDTGLGCPIVQKAMQYQIPFEALGTDYSACIGFPSQRYLDALTRLGHREIAVIPVRINKIVYIAVIGLNKKLFRGENRDNLMAIHGQFMSALFVYFPELRECGIPKNTKNLNDFSSKERDAIYWRASGKSCSEIAKIFNLSENTVRQIISVTCSKLGAMNEAHAVSKAVKLGLLDYSKVK